MAEENVTPNRSLRKNALPSGETLAEKSGNSGLSDGDAISCFYGIAQICDLLEAMMDVEHNATYQCIKRHEES